MASDDRFSEENQRAFTKYAVVKPRRYEKTKSRHAFGTPLVAETLFQLMEDGKTESIPFKWARLQMKRFTDEEIWEMYECWVAGKIHEKLQK